MPKFRKKSVVIEACQHFNDMGTHTATIPTWLIKACVSGTIYVKEGESFIKTLEGDHKVSDGDWIIRGVKGELYPIKDEIFRMTYEPVISDGNESDGS